MYGCAGTRVWESRSKALFVLVSVSYCRFSTLPRRLFLMTNGQALTNQPDSWNTLSINCITKPCCQGEIRNSVRKHKFLAALLGGILWPLSRVIFLPAKQTVPTALFAQYCWTNISDLCSSINWKAAKSIFGPESPKKKDTKYGGYGRDLCICIGRYSGRVVIHDSVSTKHKKRLAHKKKKKKHEINWEFVWAV